MSQPKDFLDVYTITTVLASSPQRTVYRSLDPNTSREVVVKLLTPHGTSSDPLLQARFLHDMGALQFLSLPAFPAILNFGITDDNSAFLVMEWIDGERLTDLADMQPNRVIPILTQVAEGLEALAMGEVFHHNLSPDNILVQTGSESEMAKIVGFGTGAFFDQTSSGMLLGLSAEAERFIAPECLETPEDILEACALSDLYPLALIAVDILGGEIRNLGSNDPEVHFTDDIRDALPNAENLEDILSGALAVDPAKRRTTYASLRNALEWDVAFGEGVTTVSDPDRTCEAQVEMPGPPPLPVSNIEEPPPEKPVPFDPNKTDPLFTPPTPTPPDLPKQSMPDGKEIPVLPESSASRRNFDRRLLLWVPVGLVIMVILAFGTVTLWRLTHRPKPKALPVAVVQPTATPRRAPPEIPPEVKVHPGLDQADILLLEGDVEGARIILSAITPEEVELFSTEETEAFTAMMDALEGSRFDAAVSDLKGGLDHGSIRMLKRGVAGLERSDPEELTGNPGVTAMLKRGQAALRLHARLWKAQENQDHALVMERASTMIDALPKYSTAFKFREEAANALEEQSDQALETGDFGRAKTLLEPVNTYWPDRPGLEQRLAALNKAEQQLEIQRATIVRALAKGREGDPEAGLELLGEISPVDMLQASHSEALTLLRQHLAELDANPPSVVINPETELSFKKKKTVTIQLTVTDDYQVTGVSAFLKTSGADGFSKIDLSLDPSTDTCSFEVGPETHNNDDFFLYVEAIDGSGHTGRLASPQAPLKFKRKKGLKALFGK